MNTTTTLDEERSSALNEVGQQLSAVRLEKGYSVEYVASKLHLRAKIIQLIEAGDFDSLPEAVFVRGYIRAYAKLLEVPPEPYLAIFNEQFIVEDTYEQPLWQNKRETPRAEYLLRWITMIFAAGTLIAISLWWQKGKEELQNFSARKMLPSLSSKEETKAIKLTDISKMHALLLSPESEMTPWGQDG